VALELQVESGAVICSQQTHSCPWGQDGQSEQQCPGTAQSDKCERGRSAGKADFESSSSAVSSTRKN